MPKYIKYLENGTYKYATVKDVGDLLQLKTSTKKDIVSAINELIAGGISGGGSGGDGLTTEDIINIINGSDAVTDINGQIAQMAADIKANKDEFDKDVAETQKELNDRMDKVQTDIQKVIDDYQTAQDAKNKEQAENIANLNNENTQIKNDLAGAKEDLENVQGDLSNFDHDVTEVKQSVDDVKGELDTKVSSTELDATNGRIDKNETDIAQNKKDIELKASQDSLDLLKGDVSKNTAALKVANDAIEGKVSREDLVNEVEDFTVKKANLFTGTREWQGWEESNSAEVIITDKKDNFGTATEFLNVSDYISSTVDNLKVGETYTISVSARSDKDTDGTVAQVFDIGEFQTTDTKDTFVRTTLQRYYVNFVATDESMTFKLGAKSLANQAHLFLSKAKLETGAKATMWEDNANDSYARIEKNDADVKVLADRVTSTVSKQKETDDKVTQNTTDIAQTAEKVETNIKALQSQDGRITENKAQITATANGLRTEFTQKTNDAIGAITDGGKNLILSSAFQTDPAMKNWQSVNNKVVVKEKNSQNWAYMNQSDLSTDNPIGLTSNYFAMKANDPLVIAFDIIIGDVSKLDNKTVLNVSYYDKDDNRVDFKDYTLTDLGIKSPTSGETNRAYIKINTTHDDVVKGAILPRLSRNGEVWMSNFFAKISSISNGDYEVANADLEDMQSTDHFKLEQTAQGLTGKADTTQLNKLSGDLTTLSNNFSTTSAGFNASLSKIDDKVNSNKEETDSALSVAKADIKATADNLSTNYTKTTDEHNYVNSQIKQSADKINLSVASVSDKVDTNQTDTDSKIAALQIVDDQIKSTVSNKADTSYVDQKANQITSTVGNKADISYVDQQDNKIQSTVASKADASQITQLSNQINLKVSQSDFDNLQIGGRNYVLDSASTVTITPTTSPARYHMWKTALKTLSPGKWTISAFYDKHVNSNGKLSMGVCTQNPNEVIKTMDAPLYEYGDGQRGDVTLDITDAQKDCVYVIIYSNGGTWNGSETSQVDISNVKLEQGTKATDWTAAEEDTISQINIDKSGVLISGNKVHITGDTTIDNASIDGAKIKNATIGNAQISNLNANKVTTGNLKSSNGRTYFDLDNASIVLNSASETEANAVLTDGAIDYTYTNFNNEKVTSHIGLNYSGDWNNSHHIPDWLYKYQQQHNMPHIGELNIGGSDFINIHGGSTVELTINNVTDIMKNHKFVNGEEQMNALSSWANQGNISFHVDDTNSVLKLSKKAPTTGKDIYISLGYPSMRWLGDYGSKGLELYKQFNAGIYMQGDFVQLNNSNGTPLAQIKGENGAIYLGSTYSGSFHIDTQGNNNVVIADNATFNAATGHIYMNETTMNQGLTVKNLNVTDYKHSVVPTSQGIVGVNAYETAEYYFGDIQEAVTDNNSEIIIPIEKIFGETVRTDLPYHVFVSSYSDAYLWVTDRTETSFIVHSSKPNANFSYEIKAKRRGYEQDRLEIIDNIGLNHFDNIEEAKDAGASKQILRTYKESSEI